MNNPSCSNTPFVTVKFKKLHPHAKAPFHATAGAAAYDLYAVSMDWDSKNCVYTYGTGLAFEIPEGYCGLLYPRSSIYKVGQIFPNCTGIIDADYRGEVSMKFSYRDDPKAEYRPGDRIGQLIIMPIPVVSFVESDELTTTARGLGGYGSTGR